MHHRLLEFVWSPGCIVFHAKACIYKQIVAYVLLSMDKLELSMIPYLS